MRISKVIIGILVVILYIAVFIPFLLPVLMGMFTDWVNNSADMFKRDFCVVRHILNQTSGLYDTITECSQWDFRPLIVFLFQFIMYFVVPAVMIFYSLLK
jgi:hypothetical protein